MTRRDLKVERRTYPGALALNAEARDASTSVDMTKVQSAAWISAAHGRTAELCCDAKGHCIVRSMRHVFVAAIVFLWVTTAFAQNTATEFDAKAAEHFA